MMGVIKVMEVCSRQPTHDKHVVRVIEEAFFQFDCDIIKKKNIKEFTKFITGPMEVRLHGFIIKTFWVSNITQKEVIAVLKHLAKTKPHLYYFKKTGRDYRSFIFRKKKKQA